MKRSNSGFTLVELIIVVIIIAVLAAIALPNYQRYVTRSWETRAKTALQENMLFMERMNARFYGYTKTRNRTCPSSEPTCKTRDDEIITTDDLPTKELCESNCGRNYQFSIAVSDDLSQYILMAYPTGPQATSSECGAFVVDSSGRKFAKYVSTGSYSVPTISANSYSDPSALFGGTDKSSECFD